MVIAAIQCDGCSTQERKPDRAELPVDWVAERRRRMGLDSLGNEVHCEILLHFCPRCRENNPFGSVIRSAVPTVGASNGRLLGTGLGAVTGPEKITEPFSPPKSP